MKELSLKVYKIQVDQEDRSGYVENMDSFTILSESFDEAIETAKKRIKIKKGEVIGSVELICVID